MNKLVPIFMAAVATFSVAEELNLKGNVQTQASRLFEDDDKNLSSFWLRANVGVEYKSDNLDGTVMVRVFAPEFGNKIDGKNYDKIVADVYFANYKWAFSNSKLNLKLGHWKTDWSESSFFGTYVDASPTSRGLESSDATHNAFELGYGFGPSQLNIMLATLDKNYNTGYIRVEENLKFDFPLSLQLAYRVNAIDRVQNTSYTTHRIAAKAAYEFAKKLRLYGEVAYLYTEDETLDEKAPNYVNTQDKYLTPGDYYVPFYIGVELPVPFIDNVKAEMEYVNDRSKLSGNSSDDDVAWAVALVKKVSKAKIQFGVYSSEGIGDIGIASRITTTFR